MCLHAADAKQAPGPVFDPAAGWIALIHPDDLNNWIPVTRFRPDLRFKQFTWFLADTVTLDPGNPKRLKASRRLAGGPRDTAPVLVNGENGKSVDILSEVEHGDAELFLEFMIPKGSNSGVYLQSMYEIQIFDSYGRTELSFKDCGGVYRRTAAKGQPVILGNPPRKNASRKAGQWQSFHIWFRAPRFDSSGKKTENARFIKVKHNGVVIHEDVVVERPTWGKITGPERPMAPVLLQGDHGPVAFRNIYLRHRHFH